MYSFDEIITCTFNRWSPEIGDPSVMGWVTVVLYLIAASFAVPAYLMSKRLSRNLDYHRESLFWILFILLYLALGINKQLDLQSGLTAVGRCFAQLGGWYENRRVAQVFFIGIMLVIAAMATTASILIWRRNLRTLWLPILGCSVTVSFVLVRAVGFHHFDQILGITLGNAKMNWILEISGILIAVLGSFVSQVRLRRAGSERTLTTTL